MPLAEPLLESRQYQTDLDTLMMNATFRILGPSIEVPGALYTGSGFLVSRSSEGDPTRSFVGVSAAHVMSGISGDHAVFVVRMRNDQTRYQRAQFPVRIVTQNALSPDGKQDAGITKVIHAQFIRDTLAALPTMSN